MNKIILKAIIHECAKQVLEAFSNDSNVGGNLSSTSVNDKENQNSAPIGVDIRGIWFVDPKKPNKPFRLNLQTQDQPKIERELYRIASKSGGPRVKVASETLHQVPQILTNPNASLFLYIGKRSPEEPDTELYLLPAKSLQQAQSLSVSNSVSSDPSHPNTIPQPQDPASEQPPLDDKDSSEDDAVGKTTAPNIDETAGMVIRRSQLNELISYLVKETFNSLDALSSEDPSMQQLTGNPDPIKNPIQLQHQDMEMRKLNRQKLQQLQKVQKIEMDKHSADEKTWKLKKRGFDTSIRDLKRSGV